MQCILNGLIIQLTTLTETVSNAPIVAGTANCVLYDIIIQLSMIALAVPIAIFVLSSSFLGRAIEEATSKEKPIKEKQIKDQNESISNIAEQLEQVKRNQVFNIAEIQQQLNKAKKEKRKLDKEFAIIKETVNLLTVKGSVIVPNILFFLSLIIASIGKICNIMNITGICIFSTAELILLFFGFRYIYKTLKIIENIAKTSDEAIFSKQIAALGIALEVHEEKKKPHLDLVIEEPPSLIVNSSSIFALKYRVTLSKGNIARDAEVWIFIPPQFDFVGQASWVQTSASHSPGYKTITINEGNIKEGVYITKEIQIKAPLQKQKYTLKYDIYAEEFRRGVQQFEIVVK